MRLRPLGSLTLAALLPFAALTACGGDDDPKPEVTALTDAFASGDFGDVDFAGSTTPGQVGTDYERLTKGLVDGLGGAKPTVTASAPSVTGTSAESTLTWTWPVPAKAWRYTSLVELRKKDGRWRVVWAPSSVRR